ncbi:hypothetical protein MLD38_000232 [Melastoma candidum]|uniref:Uncharacterized protein n=1 Tax=Melastoma candidum TaxID=119954 RepID=A0ACB9S968_9MYRT|nr:hypothetical protein MLD38_000232 [Melastoma candidum]
MWSSHERKGISRFCENDFPWRYSKEEGIASDDFQQRNYTYLISEPSAVSGYECLFSVRDFSKIQLKIGFPPIIPVKVPKVFVLGNQKEVRIRDETWPGCS